MAFNGKTNKIGDCEVSHFDGLGVNCEITLMDRNIWMCNPCKADYEKFVAQDKEAKQIIAEAKAIDDSIESIGDILIGNATPAITLFAAIDNDSSIPADEKEYAKAKACEARMVEYEKVVSNLKKELVEAQNTRKMWRVNAQERASLLRADIREKEFKHLDIQFESKVVKTIKPKVVKVSSGKTRSRFTEKDLEEVKELAVKYGVDPIMLRAMVVKKIFSTALEAAKAMARK